MAIKSAKMGFVKFGVNVESEFRQGKRIKIRFGTSFRSANGAAHTSLGQRPRFERKEDPGLKARAISTHNCQIGAGLQP